MKLLSCTIENYGKLKGVTFPFDQNLTVFCESNGYGKTTLASFLKAMFYGLESYRQGGKFCDRVRFYPFDGGKFGGNLTFEMGGKTYKIERFFDEKSETRDEVTVYCDGSMTDVFGEDIGKSIFGIDKASFERTVFIDSGEIEIASTGSINAKLNTFVEGGDEDNLESAVGILEKASKEYKKSKAGNDLITRQKTKIAELNQMIANVKNIRAALQEKYRAYDEGRALLEETEKRVVQAQQLSVVANNWERLDAMQREVAENQAQVASIKGKYPYGLPAQNELQQVKSCLAEEQKLHGKSTQKVFGEADEQKYQSLCMTFARGVPDEQSVAQTEQNMARHAALRTQISLSEGAEVPEREARLTRKFASGVPSSKELEEVEKTIEQYKEAEKVCNETPATIPQITTTSAPKKGGAQKLFILWAVVSVLLIAAAFVRLFVWQATDVVLFVLGGVSLLACGFVFLYKKAGGKHVAETVIQVENPAKRQAEQKKAELENNIRAFLLPYGYASTNGVLFDFATLKEDVNFYISYLAIEKARLAQLEKNKQEADLCEQAINGFFARFGYGGNEWVKNLSSLRADAKLYEDLQFRKQNAVAEQQNLKTQREQNLQPVVAFCEKYHIAYENVERAIGEMETDGVRLAELQKKVLADTGKIQAFQQEKNLTERPAAQDADIGALNARLHALQQAQSGRLREITEDEVQAERLDDLQNELEVAEEKLGDYKKKFELLTTSIEMLKQADYSLKERYIKPVKDSFLKYSDLLERALGEKVTMSKDFEIRYERNGKERSERHLSAGQRSLCALCFRLALIDNMYAAEKPFLILDDPFVNLDSEHLERAKGLLRELAKDGQILYFTCHPSRAIAAKG